MPTVMSVKVKIANDIAMIVDVASVSTNATHAASQMAVVDFKGQSSY